MSFSTLTRSGTFVQRGGWSAITKYHIDDIVTWLGSEWQSLVPNNIGNQPDTSPGQWVQWVFAAQVSGLPPGWIDVTKPPYNADPTGVIDATTALNAAYAFAKTNGGTVYHPPGTYTVSGTLSLDQNTVGFTVRGPGGGMFAPLSAKINFTGSGAINGMTFNSSFGIEVCNLWFNYTQLTGNVLQGNGSVHAADTQDCHIHHCGFTGPGTPTCNANIMLDEADNCTIEYCMIQNAINGVQWGPDFVNVCVIRKNIFSNNSNAHILLSSNDCENGLIEHNTFEMDVGSLTPYAIRGSDTVFPSSGVGLQAVTISYNWFGDSGGQTVNYIHHLSTWSNGKTCNVIGNYFAPSAGVAMDGFTGRWLFMGNTFDCVAYSNTGTNTTGNWAAVQMTTITNEHYGVAAFAAVAPARPAGYTDLGCEVQFNTTLLARLALAGAAVLTIDTTGGGSLEYAIFGNNASTLPAGVAGKMLMYLQSSTLMMLQAPWSGSGGGIEMLVGPTPTPAISAQASSTGIVKLGFFTNAGGGSETTQPTAPGVTAGFTAGTGTAMNNASTSTGATGSSAYTFGDIVRALKILGLIAS